MACTVAAEVFELRLAIFLVLMFKENSETKGRKGAVPKIIYVTGGVMVCPQVQLHAACLII